MHKSTTYLHTPHQRRARWRSKVLPRRAPRSLAAAPLQPSPQPHTPLATSGTTTHSSAGHTFLPFYQVWRSSCGPATRPATSPQPTHSPGSWGPAIRDHQHPPLPAIAGTYLPIHALIKPQTPAPRPGPAPRLCT